MSIADYSKKNKLSLVTILILIFLFTVVIIGSLGGVRGLTLNFAEIIPSASKSKDIYLLYSSNEKVLVRKKSSFELLQLSNKQSVNINSVFPDNEIINISYSPSGRYLFIVLSGKEKSSMFIVTDDDFNNRKIVNNLAGKDINICKDSPVKWSENNKYLLFFGCSSGYSNIYISNVESNKILNYHILNNTDELISDKKRDLTVIKNNNFLFSKVEDKKYSLYKVIVDFNVDQIGFNLQMDLITSHKE